ncbi:MAG: ATP-grasp domain-containing protein [Syntrophaceae bacterium]|nr:ATP-grasp domain-containing protein [Syntrophaceae bacterium]
MSIKVKTDKIPVVLIYNVNPEWTKEEKEETVKLSEELGQALQEAGHSTVCVAIEDQDMESRLSGFSPRDYIIFNWCESLPGVAHSEWMVAKKLEKMGYAFTGADSGALKLSQDKHLVKKMLKDAGVPTPEWLLLDASEKFDWRQYPAIVKPVYEHCSEGIDSGSVVLSLEEAKERVNIILEKYNQPVLLEDFIDGREFRVAIWGNDELEILPVAEMEYSHFKNVKDRICGYDAKFISGSEHYEKIETLLPAPLSNKELSSIEKICKKAYRVTGCRDYARLDVRYRDGIFYVLDVNPNADISEDASMACAAQTAGFSYGEMGSRIVRIAAKRHSLWTISS